VLNPHENRLPTDKRYKFIWMDRDSREHAKSNRKFMRYLKRMPDNEIPSIKELIKRHGEFVSKGLKYLREEHPESPVRRVRFEAILKRPKAQAMLMADFIGLQLDIRKMIDVVLPRSARCHQGFLELPAATKRKERHYDRHT
ncbi:hypothetical protein LCGC14_1995350, partial [marine sediment metagenome]